MHIRRNLAILFSLFVLFAFFSLSGTASAQTLSAHPKIEYRVVLSGPKHVSGGKLLVGTSASTPHIPTSPSFDDNCLNMSIGASNIAPQYIDVTSYIVNNCGLNLGGISWQYTSTQICGGQAFNGPADSGIIGIANGQNWLSTDTWYESCAEYINGNFVGFVPYEESYTLTANMVIYNGYWINYYGRYVSPSYTLD